jgi:hypothetical protein
MHCPNPAHNTDVLEKLQEKSVKMPNVRAFQSLQFHASILVEYLMLSTCGFVALVSALMAK